MIVCCAIVYISDSCVITSPPDLSGACDTVQQKANDVAHWIVDSDFYNHHAYLLMPDGEYAKGSLYDKIQFAFMPLPFNSRVFQDSVVGWNQNIKLC